MEHHLQKAWADDSAENAYFQRIEAIVQAGDLDAASAIIEEDIATLDTPLGQMCRELSEEAVDLAGWEEIGDSIAQYEGEPITAVHIMISNEPDLVFEEKSTIHHPLIEVMFYSDEHLPFSEMSRDEILAASLEEDESWWGQGEDMEAYLEINGLSQLNTALLRHKRQYYFRDQMHVLDEANGLAADTAPLLYVEFRLASMLRAIRYHQAVKALVEGFGLRKNVPVLHGAFWASRSPVRSPACSGYSRLRPPSSPAAPPHRIAALQGQASGWWKLKARFAPLKIAAAIAATFKIFSEHLRPPHLAVFEIGLPD